MTPTAFTVAVAAALHLLSGPWDALRRPGRGYNPVLLRAKLGLAYVSRPPADDPWRRATGGRPREWSLYLEVPAAHTRPDPADVGADIQRALDEVRRHRERIARPPAEPRRPAAADIVY
jgi:hypothetical protein